MRLFVLCPNTKQKIYLTNVVEHRTQLIPLFTLSCPYEHGLYHQYSSNDVIPEAELGSLTSGAIAGGLVGLLGGPEGIIIGGMIGAALGASKEEEERRKVQRFG
jgi:hypothetical protein